MYKEEELTRKIIGVAMRVHRAIGPGFQERIYQNAMEYVLRSDDLFVESEKEFDIFFEEIWVGTFRLDLVINGRVVVELKAIVGEMPKLFQTQTISYLKASKLEVGLLINFGNSSLEVKRLANYRDFNSSKSV